MKNGNYILVKAPDDFPGKKYRGRYCYEHILVYWQYYHRLPNRHQLVHHKNENTHDNRPENLEIISRSEHTKQHNVNHGVTVVDLRCPGCGRVFTRAKNLTYLIRTDNSVTCCSRKCIGKYTSLAPDEREKRKRDMFIREYKKRGEKT